MASTVLSVILAYQLRISLWPEILFGKQTKQVNFLVCYKSLLETRGDWGTSEKAMFSVLSPEEYIIP